MDAGSKEAYKVFEYDLRYGLWRIIVTVDEKPVLAKWHVERKEFIRCEFEDELHNLPKSVQEAILFNMEMFDGR